MFTSKDILFLVISFCIIWTTVFLCWVFYYLARLLKNANRIIEEFRTRLQALTAAVDHVRGRVETLADLMTVVVDGAAGLIKKKAFKSAEDFIDKGTKQFNKAAKEAVEVAAKNMGRATKKFNK